MRMFLTITFGVLMVGCGSYFLGRQHGRDAFTDQLRESGYIQVDNKRGFEKVAIPVKDMEGNRATLVVGAQQSVSGRFSVAAYVDGEMSAMGYTEFNVIHEDELSRRLFAPAFVAPPPPPPDRSVMESVPLKDLNDFPRFEL